MAELERKAMDMGDPAMMPVTERCPHCREEIELSSDQGRRGMLKAHVGEHGIVCEGSWGPGAETRRSL